MKSHKCAPKAAASSRPDADQKQIDVLRISAARFKSAFQHSGSGLVIATSEGRFLEVNEAFCTMLGYTEAELVGRRFTDVTHADDLDLSRRLHRDLEGHDHRSYTKRYIRKDGGTIWAEVTISVVRPDDGSAQHIVAQINDITEKKATEEERRRLTSIVEATSDLVSLADGSGRLLYLNGAGRAMSEISPDESLEGLAISEFLSPDTIGSTMNEALPAAAEKGLWTGENVFKARSGNLIPVSQVIIAHRSENGEVEFFSTIARDLTERNRLEEQLMQAQKMEAIGRLAGGVAHDFNNLLAVIINYATLLESDLEPLDPRRDDVAEIRAARQRAANLVSQLLAFSRKKVSEPQVVDITDVIGGLEKLLRSTIGEDIELRFSSAGEAWPTEVDPGHLEQVLMNLAVNARDAMPHGGKLSIKTYNQVVEAAYAATRPGLEIGRYTCFSVSDTGTGIEKDVLLQIFDPFFTTKPQGKGTGLGLSTVYGIVKSAGGHIAAYSEPGLGTSFKIYLPACDSAGEKSDEPTSNKVFDGHGIKVLVVEDEESVRRLVARLLTRQGYEVVAVASGSLALDLITEGDIKPDLLLSDVIMPGMSGLDLAKKLPAHMRDMKILFMSGYSEEMVADRGRVGDRRVLEKPFTEEQLLTRVREVLNS